jgi:hypothetical protein
MRVFFATKFNKSQDDSKILVSMGCVAENGRTFYAEVYDYNNILVKSMPWTKDKLTTELGQNISPDTDVRGTQQQVAVALSWWIGALGEQLELWSDAPACDWPLLCELFGGANFVPKSVYYPPFDLNTLFKLKGLAPDADREEFAKLTGGQRTDALWDAQVLVVCYDKLMTM